MRRVLTAVILAFALIGCGGPGSLIDTEPLPVSQTLPPLAQTAQKAVNEANGWLASVAIVVKQDSDAGLISKDKALEYKAQFQRQAKALDEMQALIDACSKDIKQCDIIGDAESRAKIITGALRSLRKQLAERRGK